MRRRLINETKNSLTLEYNQKTVSSTSGSFTVKIYYGGELLKDDGVTVSKSETWISSVSYYESNGNISIYYQENTDIVNSRSGTVTITYQGETVELELTQNAGSVKVTLTDANNYDSDYIACFVNSTETSKHAKVSYGNASDYNWSFTWSTGGSNWLTLGIQSGAYQYIIATEDYYGDSCRYGLIYATHKETGKSGYAYIYQYGAATSNFYGGILGSDKKEYLLADMPSGVIPIGIKMPKSSWQTLEGYYYSFNTMSYDTPDTGTSNKYSYQSPCYGGYGYTIGGMTSSDTPEQLSAKILAVDNSYSTAWKTASKITNTTDSQYIHPAAQCCWRYHPTGTNQGDWCLPTDYMASYIAGRYADFHGNTQKLVLAAVKNKYGKATDYSYSVLGGRETNTTTCHGGNWTGSTSQTTTTLDKKGGYNVRAVIYAPQST